MTQYMARPTQKALDGVKQILAWLSTRPNIGIVLTAPPPKLVGDHKYLNPFCFADGAYMNKQLGRSTLAFAVKCNIGLLMSKSAKTDVVCTSSTEVEVIAFAQAVKFMVWLLAFYAEIGVTFGDEPQIMYGDNTACEFIFDDVAINDRTKHIGVRVWYLRQRFHDSNLTTVHLSDASKQLLADVLTKAKCYDDFAKMMQDLTGFRSKHF